MSTTEEAVWKDVLTSYGDQYKELSDTWKLVETKAQTATAIGGVFLAAAFAWTREQPAGFQPMDRALLCLVMFNLLVSIGCAIFSMRIRSAALPPYGRVTRDTAEDLTDNGFDPERVSDFYRTLIEQWEDANERVIRQISDKADWVYMAQILLAWAAALSFVLAVRVVVGKA